MTREAVKAELQALASGKVKGNPLATAYQQDESAREASRLAHTLTLNLRGARLLLPSNSLLPMD